VPVLVRETRAWCRRRRQKCPPHRCDGRIIPRGGLNRLGLGRVIGG
jgi:hypothetical protein